jgi:hypothetical protein
MAHPELKYEILTFKFSSHLKANFQLRYSKLRSVLKLSPSVVIDLLPIRFPADTRKKLEYNGAMHQLFVDFKKAYDSIKREVLYNILLET